MKQRIFQCDKCGSDNIFIDGIDYCVICGCDVDFGDVIFSDDDYEEIY